MNILILGAGGMLGNKLVAALGLNGQLSGQDILKITRHDVVLSPPPPQSNFEIETQIGDLSAHGEAEKLVGKRPDVIFHLAAIVSGEAETNFEKGYAINFDGTRSLLEAIRRVGGGYCPRLIFTSSIAVFGAPFADLIEDDFFTTPLTSYGTQKAMCELLISDYSRKGILDGIALRMPTICVRPGKPNKAASGFFSNIIREPLVGLEAVLPVNDSVRHWHASPRMAVGMLVQAAELGSESLGNRRTLTMPGVSCTVAEQIEAMVRVAGADCAKLIRREPDETIARIVSGWPQNFNPHRALALGFKADRNFDDIIRIHIADELQGTLK
jgi:D-erythronate 2-dehydrogenase